MYECEARTNSSWVDRENSTSKHEMPSTPPPESKIPPRSPKDTTPQSSTYASVDVVKKGNPSSPYRVPNNLEEPLKRRLSLENIMKPPLPDCEQEQKLEDMGLAVEDGMLVRKTGKGEKNQGSEK